MNYGELFEQLGSTQPEKPISLEERAVQLKLTPAQADAVMSSHQGEVVVSAAAGSGKTRVLLTRTKQLIKDGVNPQDILLCAFTKAAATEMQQRLEKMMGRGCKQLPSIATIHGHQLRMLKKTQSLNILREEDCAGLLLELRQLVGQSEALDLLDDDSVMSELNFQRENGAEPNSDWHLICKAWEELLARDSIVDFAGLLTIGCEQPPSKRYLHILVDEAQDLTKLQLRWVRHHCSKKGTIFYVGDDLQSIYAFRGGDIDVLKQIELKGAKPFVIEQNFRSAAQIVQVANEFMAGQGLVMQATSEVSGEVSANRFESFSEEVSFCLELQKRFEDFCVLTRTNELAALLQFKGLKAMTIHQSKGREFDCVAICANEKGVFPNMLGKIAEEQRLMYVALTRAKKRLAICSSPKKINGKEYAHSSLFFDRISHQLGIV